MSYPDTNTDFDTTTGATGDEAVGSGESSTDEAADNAAATEQL